MKLYQKLRKFEHKNSFDQREYIRQVGINHQRKVIGS